MFRSFEHFCGIGSAWVSNYWLNLQVSKDTVCEISVRVALTQVDVFKLYTWIPNPQVILLPQDIHIWILFDMQPGQTGVKPCSLDLQNHFQGLTNLVHLEKADDSERDIHSEEIAMVCPRYFVLVVPSR